MMSAPCSTNCSARSTWATEVVCAVASENAPGLVLTPPMTLGRPGWNTNSYAPARNCWADVDTPAPSRPDNTIAAPTTCSECDCGSSVARDGRGCFLHPVCGRGRMGGMSDTSATRSLGRNDPCWCGSGRKYKRCHAAGDRPKPQRRGAAVPKPSPERIANRVRPGTISPAREVPNHIERPSYVDNNGIPTDENGPLTLRDRKSTRLNSSHVATSYA